MADRGEVRRRLRFNAFAFVFFATTIVIGLNPHWLGVGASLAVVFGLGVVAVTFSFLEMRRRFGDSVSRKKERDS
jgi:Flp pilus assembly protein TadB